MHRQHGSLCPGDYHHIPAPDEDSAFFVTGLSSDPNERASVFVKFINAAILFSHFSLGSVECLKNLMVLECICTNYAQLLLLAAIDLFFSSVHLNARQSADYLGASIADVNVGK